MPTPKKPRLRANKRLNVPSAKESHDVLMGCSKAYRTWHTRQVLISGPTLAEALAQGVAQQCNALAHHLFDVDECAYPAQALLEDVIKALQARV